jgi:hypothetical protein
MTEFDEKYDELKAYISELEKKFIDRFLSSGLETNPEEYELDIRAYCILSHAAFEDYFEQIAEGVMIKGLEKWYSPSREITPPLLALAAYSEKRIGYNEKKTEIPFDQLREIFDETKTKLSTRIRKENHGISVEHLANMLLPVGLYIKQDVNLRNSLDKLVKQRGLYAHQGRLKKHPGSRNCKKLRRRLSPVVRGFAIQSQRFV